MLEGRLPIPRGPQPATVARALHMYRRAWPDVDALDTFTPTMIRRRQRARALLMLYLDAMTRQELAHYYAGVRKLLTLDTTFTVQYGDR